MIRHKITYGSVFTAVELANNSNFHLLALKRKKQELDILKKDVFTNFDDLILALKSCKHLFLIINSDKVLIKMVHFTHIAKESVVKTAFPNISINDFYYEVFDNGTSSLVSICRKEVVHETVILFQEKGISVIQFSLGNTSFQKLLPFLNDFHFHSSNGVFEVKDHKVIEWSKSKESSKNYDVNGLTVTSNQLLPLAGIVSYCNGIDQSLEQKVQRNLVIDYQQKRIFQLGTRLGLGFLFITLIINFLLFNNYNTQVSELKSELAMNEVYKKQLLRVKDLVTKKKRMVERMNSVSNSRVVWYFDEIAKSVPRTISLDQLEYQPLLRSIKKDKPITYETNKMIVAGVTKDDSDLTYWINLLEKKDWIQKVTIKDIGGENTQLTSFDFVVHLKAKYK